MGFEKSWTAEVLRAAPLIAPARQFVWPLAIPGEEDALGRGAVRVMVKPRVGGSFLVTAALGFKDASMPTGVWGCPDADWICVLAGGYGYLASTLEPERVTLLAMKPVVQVVEAEKMLLFVGFQTILAWGRGGMVWETGKLSWEGVKVSAVTESEVVGLGWDLMADVEREFRVNLRTGTHVGGGVRESREGLVL